MSPAGTNPDVGTDHQPEPNERPSVARWTELDHRRRRHVIVRTIVEVVLTWTLLFGIYYLVPFTDRTSAESVMRFALGTVVFVAGLRLAVAPGDPC